MFFSSNAVKVAYCLFPEMTQTSAKFLAAAPQQRYAANVNLFNNFLLGAARSQRFCKGVEVHDDKVYLRHGVVSHFLRIAIVATAGEDPAKNLRVQRFHAAAKDCRKAGKVFHGGAGDSEFFDKSLGATGAVEGYVLPVQGFEQRFQPVFIEYRNEGRLDSHSGEIVSFFGNGAKIRLWELVVFGEGEKGQYLSVRIDRFGIGKRLS